jgi:hypothetical protein
LHYRLSFCLPKRKKLSDKSAQITLNDKGIETSASGYHNWDTVQDEDVITERRGKTTVTFLVFTYTGGSERSKIDSLAIGRRQLEKLLRIYRGRWEQKHKQ